MEPYINKINWKAIIISAVITGIITIAATLTINKLTSKKINLVYTSQESITFENDTNKLKIYSLDIINDGDELIENVSSYIIFDNYEIKQKKIGIPPHMEYKDSTINNSFFLNIPTLNPNEKVSLIFLLNARSNSYPLPQISLRGKGVIGIEKKEATKDSGIIPNVLLAIGMTMSAILFYTFIRQKIDPKTATGGGHSDEQKWIFAYLCGINGLTKESRKYIDKDAHVSYWAESDNIAFEALNDNNEDNNLKRVRLLENLLEYASINDSSKAIVLFNIAKIYKILKNEPKSNECLEQSLKILPKIINLRLKIDPILQK